MKASKIFNERGQALVIIAFSAVALIAFTALAIDGSAVFSDRRHSQNAADTAVLAAALAKVRGESWQTAGLSRAADNSYNDSDPETQVIVSSCAASPMPTTEDGVQVQCKGLPAGADPNQYIVVHIKSVVHLTFARVIGRYTVTNHTEAVSRATVPVVTTWFDGYAIASLHQGCRSPGDGDPFELGGNANVHVTGSGVLVNASCPTQDSFVQSGISSTMLTTDGGTCVVGTADNTHGVTPPPTEGCNGVDPSTYQMPSEPQCANAGVITGSGGTYTASPGYYDSTFPNVSGGSATIKLTKGVYCLNNGIKVNAGWTFTTDLNGNHSHDAANEGVLFYVPHGDVTFNGGADIFLHAISSSSSGTFSQYWINLLMYIPPSNEADIEISGNSGSQYTGTILAPSSHVHLLGNGGTVGLNSQIISDTVKISGSTTFDLSYNSSDNSVALENPGVEMTD